jgi:hypothetical protein
MFRNYPALGQWVLDWCEKNNYPTPGIWALPQNVLHPSFAHELLNISDWLKAGGEPFYWGA